MVIRRGAEADARPVVHLFDGHVYVFRAYHALPAMTAPDGTPTGATYGFANTLLKYLAEQQATHVAVCFDASMESFRNALFPGYKATRGATPPDLEPQFALCGEVARALGLAVYEQEPYEADDLIATLATKLAAKGADVVIVTGDKDLSQLVRDGADDAGSVVLHDLAKAVTLDERGVRERFGVAPDQMPDYLGLVGDAVDNLPGVPGVGPKSAAAALAAFGSIEHVPSDPAAWSGVPVRGAARVAAAIDAHRAQALRVRELATVACDVPGVRAALDGLGWRGAVRAQVEPLFARLGWKGIAGRIPRFRD